MIKTLVKIAKQLNEKNVQWALGGSLMLLHHGLAEDVHDLDIMVATEDFWTADAVLLALGVKNKKREENSPIYLTDHFSEYQIDGIDVDLMAGMQIQHEHGIYRYCFDELSNTEIKNVSDVTIHYTALEDWYVLYQLMPQRILKVQAIEHHLTTQGINNPLLLERALRGTLPMSVKNRIEGLLYQSHPEYKVI